MPHTLISRMLGPLGLHQIDNGCLQPIRERLGELGDDLWFLEKKFDSAEHIVSALNINDNQQAIMEALDFLTSDDNSSTLAWVRDQVMSGVAVESVLSTVELPILMKEIINGVKKALIYSYGDIMALMVESMSLGESVSERSLHLSVAAEHWAWPERLGALEALDDAAEAVLQLEMRVGLAQQRLDGLQSRLEQLLVH